MKRGVENRTNQKIEEKHESLDEPMEFYEITSKSSDAEKLAWNRAKVCVCKGGRASLNHRIKSSGTDTPEIFKIFQKQEILEIFEIPRSYRQRPNWLPCRKMNDYRCGQ